MRQRDAAQKQQQAFALQDRDGEGEAVFDVDEESRKDDEDRALLEADELIRAEEERNGREKV